MKNLHGPLCASLIALALLAVACKKNAQSTNADLLEVAQSGSLKINQAIELSDATAWDSSRANYSPPINRFYRWTISPADDAAAWSGLYQHGSGAVIFNQTGTFQVKADIYDSLNQHLLGHTTAVTIQVSSDSLYDSQPLQHGDQLIGTIRTLYSYGRDTVILNFGFTTADSYSNDGASVLKSTYTYAGANNFVFSDSAYLATFPFAFSTSQQEPATTNFLLGFIGPDSEPLNITWLGNNYSGTINIDAQGRPSLIWNNSGPAYA